MNSAVSESPPPTRVLFADDDRHVREAIARLLRRNGMIVDLASDGIEALALAREFPYPIVVTDYRMPGLSGVDLVRSLQTIRPEATYVILTGALEAVEGLGRMTHIHSVVAKPWTEDGLVGVIQAGLRDAQQRGKHRSGSSDSFIAVGGQFVLLVEDNDLDALLLTETIELAAPREFRIVRARSLAEATKFLQKRAYSIVLADLGLSDSAGLSTLTDLLGVSPDTPVLVITGADDQALATEAVRAGAQDYLFKGNYVPDAVLRSMRYAVERKRIDVRLSDLAHYDPLTGVANRALMTERQTRALSRAERLRHHVALLAVDLDHFKAVNDTHGHDVGDAVLVEVARRLSASTRTEDTVARMGGDEFLILLEDLDDADAARRVAKRVQNAFATPMLVAGRQLSTTPSVGIALFPDDAANLGELQRHADAALYDAKRSGRNAYCFFSRDLQRRARRRLDLEQNLGGALAAGKLHIEYLPEVDTSNGKVHGYEALLRWDREGGQTSQAREFLDVLEECGQIVQVGRWVIGEVCAAAAALPRFTTIRLSVNVSARELAEPTFVDIVESALKSRGIDGGRIQIEFTEASLSINVADVRDKLLRLAALGVTTAVDGYGVGRSSILELAELPVRTIKLHDSLTTDGGTPRRRAVFSTIVGVASGLGWSAVATRVETSEQLEMIRRLGCRRAQGHFLGRTIRNPAVEGLHV